MDVKIAATKTKNLVNSSRGMYLMRTNFRLDKTKVGHNHTMMLLDSIETGKVTNEKAHRWLGWAQCAIVSAGVADLCDMKSINHAA